MSKVYDHGAPADPRVIKTIATAEKDAKGRIALWGIHEKKWIHAYPVDAREMLGRGLATFKKPDGSPPPSPDDEDLMNQGGESGDDDPGGSKASEGYAAMELRELRDLGRERGVDGAASMPKKTIVEALEALDAKGGGDS